MKTEKNPIKDVKEMVGEFLRETASLVIVFAFLDKLVFDHPVGLWWTILTFAASGTLLVLGISLERRRKT